MHTEALPPNDLTGRMPDPEGQPIAFDLIRSSTGDVDGLSVGSGPFTVDAETFDRIVWPLMSDLNRSQFTTNGACAIYR